MARKQNGFTLIEMAIVMVIIAILMSGAMKLTTAYMAGRQNSTLNAAVEAAKADAAMWAANNKAVTLVCVAGPAGCPSDGCATGCSTYPVSYSLVLDDPAEHMDPWGVPVRYIQHESLVTATTDPTDRVFSVISAGPDSIADTGDDLEREVTASEVLSLIAKMGIGG